MFSHLDAELVSVNATPVLGYKLNDMISIAIGRRSSISTSTSKRRLHRLPRRHGNGSTGDDTDVGLVAGVTLTPFDGTTIGIGYRSTVKHSLDGSQSFDIPVGRHSARYQREPIRSPPT